LGFSVPGGFFLGGINMSRPRKAVVDYFPHYVNHGKTMFTIESKYGNDGYSFWFKTLELLGATDHHFLDCNDTETWEYLIAITKVSENTAKSILDTCSKLGAIDQDLWGNKIIRSDNFIENLNTVYKRREISVISKEEVLCFCKQKSQSTEVPSNRKPQSKVQDSKVYQSEREETRAEERIIKENPNPVSGSKNQEPGKEEIQIQEENPKPNPNPNPEAEEKTKIQEPKKTSRAPKHESQNLFEDEFFNQPDLIGSEPEPESEQQEQGSDHNPEVEPNRIVMFMSAEPKDPLAPEELESKESEVVIASLNLNRDQQAFNNTKILSDLDDW
jgi:hypothetical protein